jgi:ESX secretion system protein EccD
LALTGLGVLVVVAVFAASAGLAVAGRRFPAWVLTAMAYLEYMTVAALMPLGLWVLW